jgi:hypothetical protein
MTLKHYKKYKFKIKNNFFLIKTLLKYKKKYTFNFKTY